MNTGTSVQQGYASMIIKTRPLIAAALIALSACALPSVMTVTAHAAEIRYVVNGTPVMSTDIQRRAAFLRLQQRKGNVQQLAADEMIEQTLRAQEMKRLRIDITDQQVDAAYQNFAKSNKLTTSQMDQVLGQAGVTKSHFKEFIRSQIGWNQALGSRARGGEGRNAVTDAVREMFKKGGPKPSTTEYVLEQVILVVPERDRRALLGKRKREAQDLRARYTGCNTSKELVRGMLDVTVRSLGRVLEPELPPDWEKAVKATKAGAATAAQETPRGVEFIGVCSTRVTSDDRVAELQIMKSQAQGGNQIEEMSKTYTAELRSKARISQP